MKTQQDHEFAKKIIELLDQDSQRIDAGTTAKLLKAREEALAHFQAKPTHTMVPAWATAAVGRFAEPYSHNLRAGFVLLVFLASLAAVFAWQTLGQQSSEIADIDEGLLTDELPINAYLDKGFDSWLKRPSH
ncbi:MAG TPA: DUF3619 family protein [Burkholderiales bacterium]|nr:DUF3619 family protein [Burkholderiales bacterium]